MKKNIIITALCLFALTVVNAQEYKLAKSSGRLEISEVNHVTIEGTTGNEIVFTRRGYDRDQDDRAKGLRAVSAMGIEDNTGIGLSVIDKGESIQVQQLKKMDGPDVTIKVPKGVIVVISHTSPHGEEIEFKNFEGEIQVSTVHSGVKLENITGPTKVKTIHGDIDATLSPNMKSPITLASIHGHVDAAFAVATKANIRLGTKYGELFLDPDFKLEREKAGEFVKYSSDEFNAKLNGGGLDLTFTSTHGNVYIRKR
jgi:hypothetical protein